MMRASMFRAFAIAASFAAFATVAAAEELKIAVVDLDQAINATEQGKKARDELQTKQKQAEGQLKPMYEKGKALAEEIQSKRFVLSEDSLRQKQLDLAEIADLYLDAVDVWHHRVQRLLDGVELPRFERPQRIQEGGEFLPHQPDMAHLLDRIGGAHALEWLEIEEQPILQFAPRRHQMRVMRRVMRHRQQRMIE